MNRKIKFGSRESRLAVIQTEMVMRAVCEAHPELETELVAMKTTGDKILDRTLDRVGGKGLFVKELDQALLEERADVTVHSLKDVPMQLDKRLPLVAYSRREDARDALVLPQGKTELDPSLPIGCSSLRRRVQLQKVFPDMRFQSIRGNVQTRLAKLDGGAYSALVLAGAGLRRLGLEGRIHRYFSVEECIPACGQGIIAVQAHQDTDVCFLKEFNCEASAQAAAAERAFVRELDGGCSSPVAAHARVADGKILLTGLYYDMITGKTETGSLEGECDQAEKLGIRLARELSGKAKQRGKVYLVGSGPSDVGLFTLRGKQLLQEADVVVYDALAGRDILDLIPADTRRIDVGKHAGNHPVPQDEINRILLREAQQGNKVVRLKGGDPFMFGRGGEELELLIEAGIPYEIVPGVTSAVAVPAYAGIPVTHRDCCSSVHIITGHTKKSPGARIDYEALVRLDGTLVFLMGVGALEEICRSLVEAGMPMDMPAAILERGTTAVQRRVVATVATLPERARAAAIQTPAIIVVGHVCALADRFAWAEKRPLGGVRVVVTRPRTLASRMTEMLRSYGAQVVELPCIVTEPVEPNEPLDDALDRIKEYGWMVFTSPSGVALFFAYLRRTRRDIRALGDVKLAAIGSATARRLAENGLVCALVPQEYNAKALGASLGTAAKGEKVLLVRAREGTADLTAALDQAGVGYDDIALYETKFASENAGRVAQMLDEGRAADYIAFTSASTVKGFVGALEGKVDFTKVKAVCIGQSTKAAAEEYGMQTYTAEKATIESMAECMIQMHRFTDN